jgi:eukaryotic-like serine/threonine-protein kinase
MTVLPAAVGRYQIEQLIAHGGMGSVYLARDPAIDRQVVIKLLKEGFDDLAARERFAREARSAGRLQHPNIVTVFDVGEHEERPFIAMEYVRGQTLLQFIRQGGVIRTWEKLAILEDVCAGLHYAHAVGIIHRDIKPANVMRLDSGMVKILDFGVARANAGPITRAGDVVGTLNYMSPEQLTGEPVDHRSDVYAVGALAYELFTHRMAFPGTIDTGVLHKILTSSHVPIEDLVPGLDPEIAVFVERAMARAPEARYQNLEDLRQDIEVVRVRLLETADDSEEPLNPDAETRIDSGRIGSAAQQRPASRRSSTIGRTMYPVAPHSATNPAPRTGTKSTVLLAVACAALAGALVATVILNRSPAAVAPASDPAAVGRPTRPEPAAPSTPDPAPPVAGPLDEQLRNVRDDVRRQIAAGERQAALDALTRGLALDANDPVLGGLAADLAVAASRITTDARTAAAARNANAESSAEFRRAESRRREAENLVRAGDRVGAIRTFLAAAALYDKSSGLSGPTPSAISPPKTATVDPVPPASGTPAGQPSLTVPPPSPEPSPAVTTPVPAPPAAVSTPALPAPAPHAAPAPREPSPEPRSSDQSTIRDTLRRYSQAYQSLNSAEVGKIMPLLSVEQLRRLDRDFSNYRRYGVDIRGEQIEVAGATATVTCEIVRSYETKNGVGGSNAVASVFHLRRSGAGWIIERLESR